MTKANDKRLENLAKKKEVEAIRWKNSMEDAGWVPKEKVDALVADYQKTIEMLTQKVADKNNENQTLIMELGVLTAQLKKEDDLLSSMTEENNAKPFDTIGDLVLIPKKDLLRDGEITGAIAAYDANGKEITRKLKALTDI